MKKTDSVGISCSSETFHELAFFVAASLQNKYEESDGSALLHVIKECPRSYYMAFIIKRGSSLVKPFNNFIRRLFEAGKDLYFLTLVTCSKADELFVLGLQLFLFKAKFLFVRGSFVSFCLFRDFYQLTFFTFLRLF